MREFWKNHKKVMLGIFVIIVAALVAGISYAYIRFTTIQNDDNKLATLCLNLKFEEGTNSGINIEEAYPISDAEGQRLTPYTFTITNTCKNITPYQVNLDILVDLAHETSLGLEYIRSSLNGDSSKLLSSYPTTVKSVEEATISKELANGTLAKDESVTYELRLWMDENTTGDEGANKEFDSKIVVTASTAFPEYKESILNGAEPVLAEGLIPVTIEEDGTIKIADITDKWYSYEEHRWANAIILNSGKSASDYADKVVPEEDIESYFVWIPRYRYKIWNTGNYPDLTSVTNAAQTIDVVFENKDTIPSTGTQVGEYLTHPAFTAFGTNGLWVGKFETGYRGAGSTAGAQSNTYDTSKVIIKPNVYSWRYINVANAHKNSFNYKREYDSHMMKNTEWGAVAYLQHSMYGSRKSVRINNNSSYVTGYAAKNEPTTGYTATNIAENVQEGTALGVDGTNTYNYLSPQKDGEGNVISDLASTTANKSGVYDMSGGAWEYVMGVMLYSDNKTLCAGSNLTYTSGFAGRYCESASAGTTSGEPFPAEKYYDMYVYSTSSAQFQRGILGDATKEIGPFADVKYEEQSSRIGSWYADSAWFVYSGKPWFARGGVYMNGVGTGLFAFYPSGSGGSIDSGFGFRIVLAI